MALLKFASYGRSSVPTTAMSIYLCSTIGVQRATNSNKLHLKLRTTREVLYICLFFIFKYLLLNHITTICLRRLHLKTTKTSNGRSDSDSRRGTQGVTSTGNGLVATAAIPNPGTLALDAVLAAKDAPVGGMLRYFNLAQQFTKSTTVPCSVLARDANLLRAFAHCECCCVVCVECSGKEV